MKAFEIIAQAVTVITVAACCVNPSAGPITTGEDCIAQTKYGKVEGYNDAGIYTFKGIRYAKADRFMPPQDPDCFEEVQKCQSYGPKCYQSQGTVWKQPSDYDFGFEFKNETMSEDCQVLNVWTPALDGKKRPVFVWIHGGGYSSGSAIFLPAQDGRSLAEKGDIVVVTVNHRLNVLGYLDLSFLGGEYAQSVNLGMQDLVKALEWVNQNIGNFGGDPGCVTIGGQSGGGGKTSTLMAMPSAKGLFHRAIVQSGSTLRQTESADAQASGVAFLNALGIQCSLENASAADLSPLQTASWYELNAAAGKARVRQSPVVDGVFLPAHPFDPVGPEISKDVPMLIGSNLNEFCYTNNVEFIVDERTRAGVVRQATAKSAQDGAPAYVYLFKWLSEVNDGALAACHGMELPFMFNNIAAQREMTGGTKEAYRLADIVSSAWIRFIRTGDPNGKGLPVWEPFSAETEATMTFDNVCAMQYK